MDSIRSASTPAPRVDGNLRAATPAPGQGGVQLAPVRADAGGGAQPAPAPAAGASAMNETREKLEALLEQVGPRIQPDSRALSFRVSEAIDGVVVSVIDNATDEVIRQIPSETMIRLAEKLKQLDAEPGGPGLLFSDQA